MVRDTGVRSASGLDSRAYSVLAWTILAGLVALCLYLSLTDQWGGAAILVFSVGTLLLLLIAELPLPRAFHLLLAVTAALNAFGYAFDLWNRLWAYDEATHALTTLVFTVALGALFLGRASLSHTEQAARLVGALTLLGLTLGVVWELFEWAIGIIGDPSDTAVDLVMDTIGAAAAGLFCAAAAADSHLTTTIRN